METKKQEEVATDVPSTPQNMLAAMPRKRNLFIILGIALVVIVALGGYSYIVGQQQKIVLEKIAKEKAAIPTQVPSPTLPALSPDFISYLALSGEEKFAVAYNFSDPILNVGFAYPPGYTLQSLKAENTDRNAFVFFTRAGNPEQAEDISDAIDCKLDNRVEPGGVCQESYLGDVEVDIAQHILNSDNKFYETGNPHCQKDIDTKNRVLFSCEEQLSPSSADTGMQYKLYLLGENPVLITVSAKDAKEQAHLIRSVISSATNHL